MPGDERLNALEGEFKLMRGEVKQSLVDVRDFLLSLKLPQQDEDPAPGQAAEAPEENAGPEAIVPAAQTEPAQQNLPLRPQESQTPLHPSADRLPDVPHEDFGNWEAVALDKPMPLKPEAEPQVEQDMPVEAPQTEKEYPPCRNEEDKVDKRSAGERNAPGPQVNMLTNLIRWVSVARSELGAEQVPVLLDIYAMAGHMPPGLKEMILKLADSVGQQQGQGGSADTWSRLALELHGILSGGGDPTDIRLPDAEGNESEQKEEAKEDQPDQPVRLRLVLPGSDGLEREFAINLTPEATCNGRSSGNGNGKAGK